MLCKNKKPHSFFACLLFLEGQQGAGNSSPTTFTDNSPKEFFWRTYLNKKRQGLPVSTEVDLRFCMDVVGCGWCLAEAYHVHSKNNNLQWARPALSNSALVLKQWHDIQKWQKDSVAGLWCWRIQKGSSSKALKQVAPDQKEASLLPKSGNCWGLGFAFWFLGFFPPKFLLSSPFYIPCPCLFSGFYGGVRHLPGMGDGHAFQAFPSQPLVLV